MESPHKKSKQEATDMSDEKKADEKSAKKEPPKPTEEQIKIVKSTAPVLKEHGLAIVKVFYPLLFAQYPETTNIFNMSHQRGDSKQPQALANAVYAYAEYIDDLGKLTGAVQRICMKHCGLKIQPHMYSWVGDCLIQAIGKVLGEAATPAVVDAWKAAYGYLAQICINVEYDFYQASLANKGWSDFKVCTVHKKVHESSNVSSFYFKPKDGSPLPSYQAGQYITVRVGLGEGKSTMRNYSLSSFPGQDYFRLSIKREGVPYVSAPFGLISTYMHDYVHEGSEIEVGSPYGHFTLKEADYKDEKTNIYFISCGIGITAVLGMLHKLVQEKVKNPLYFLHATQNGAAHALKKEVHDLVKDHSNMHLFTSYTRPLPWDVKDKDYQSTDRLTVEKVKSILPSKDGQFYFLGPSDWMLDFKLGLQKWGVDASNIHYEFFGPEIEGGK